MCQPDITPSSAISTRSAIRSRNSKINLQQLASVHLGLSETSCRFPSWIKKEMDRAHEELIGCNFLKSDAGTARRVPEDAGRPVEVTYLFPVGRTSNQCTGIMIKKSSFWEYSPSNEGPETHRAA
jgi:hypothetical protein